MWKNSLKKVESDNHKIFYETLLDFLKRNGIYFLNKPRNSTLSLTYVLDGVACQSHTPVALPPGKETWYSWYRKLGGPQSRYGRARETSHHQNSIPAPFSP